MQVVLREARGCQAEPYSLSRGPFLANHILQIPADTQRVECCLSIPICVGSQCLSLVQGVLREAHRFQAGPNRLTRDSLAGHLL